MPGTVAPIPSPSEAGRPPGLQPMQMAVLQGAHFLQESSAGNAENQLEIQVNVCLMQWSPTQGFFTGACAAKRSQEEFSDASCQSCRVFQRGGGRGCCVKDPVQDLRVS